MNFNIIDGNDLEEYEEEFKKLYMDMTLPVRVIPERLGITTAEYRRLRKNLLEKGEITLRRNTYNIKKPTYKQQPKNYSINRSKGHDYFSIRHNNQHYGSVKTVQQAEEMVRRLRECNWDKNQAESIRQEVMENY